MACRRIASSRQKYHTDIASNKYYPFYKHIFDELASPRKGTVTIITLVCSTWLEIGVDRKTRHIRYIEGERGEREKNTDEKIETQK